MSHHIELVKQAEAAIDKVFNDKSVGQNTTRESLEELRDEINALLDSLEDDAED